MAQASQKELNVLVSGGGVAGPCLAWWLTRPNSGRKVNVTIVERAARPRPAGQNIDIRGRAVEVVKQMGLLDTVLAKNTTEKGVSFVNTKNKELALFPVETGNSSFTSEYEITRSDLVQIFLDATENRKGIRYIYGETITSITEEANGAQVEFANGSPAGKYDYVIGADGLGSKVRRLVWPEAGSSVFRSLGMFAAFFTIPKASTDSDIARWFNAPGRRVAFLRPDNQGTTRAFLSIISEDPRLRQILKHGDGTDNGQLIEKQKALLEDIFGDAGWELDRVLKQMHASEDFYMQEIAQVHMGQLGWYKGHAALVGDAAYCPSPITGMGTALAITGCYYLAGSILKHGDNHGAALKEYQDSFKPQVDEAQKLFPGVPKLANPSSPLGVWFMGVVLKTVSTLKVSKWFAGGEGKAKKEPLPDFGITA